jgi:hypothetical protein
VKLDYNSATFTNTAGSQNGATVACDAGLRVVGGGVSTSGGYNQQQVNASYPSNPGSGVPPPGTTAWTAYVDNLSGGAQTFTVTVICTQPSSAPTVAGPSAGATAASKGE